MTKYAVNAISDFYVKKRKLTLTLRLPTNPRFRSDSRVCRQSGQLSFITVFAYTPLVYGQAFPLSEKNGLGFSLYHYLFNKGTTELKNETASIEQKTDEKVNDMIDSISGSGEIKSFVSDKNTNVKSVQFVIKTDAMEISEAEEQESN